MFHRWAAPVLVLALCATSPKHAAGQSQAPRGHGVGKLGSADKNPFNPHISIQFSVGDENCNANEQHVVSIRILNILAQPVVVPVYSGPAPNSTGTGTTSASNGAPISNVTFTGCGTYVMFWDGYLPGGREAPSGVYAVQIITDGKVTGSKKIYYAK
jgi:hypothetical protein